MTITVRYAQDIPPPVETPAEETPAAGEQGEQGEQGDPGEPGEDLVSLPPQYESGSGTIVLDLSLSKSWRISLTGDATLEVIGGADGDKFSVSLTQDATGGREVTWWDDIRWSRGGTEPTLTAIGNQRDTFGFEIWQAGEVRSYDGFVIGQDI